LIRTIRLSAGPEAGFVPRYRIFRGGAPASVSSTTALTQTRPRETTGHGERRPSRGGARELTNNRIGRQIDLRCSVAGRDACRGLGPASRPNPLRPPRYSATITTDLRVSPWKVLSVCAAVRHRQHGFGVVDVPPGSKARPGIGAANTVDQAECRLIGQRCPPHFPQYCRCSFGFSDIATLCRAPAVIRTARPPRLKAFTGRRPRRQEPQWHSPSPPERRLLRVRPRRKSISC